jgi:hypothetical protein
MSRPPLWFRLLSALALLWNVAGLFAVITDLRLSAADIAALPAQQQAMYSARPSWAVIASLIAVVGGTGGCIALLVRSRRALLLFYASLVGVVLQDIGIFVVAGADRAGNAVPIVLQGLVLAIAVGLIIVGQQGRRKSWLS